MKFRLFCAGLVLLNGCSSAPENFEPPTELSDFSPSVEVRTVWSRSTGSFATDSFLRMPPAVVEDRVFAAAPDGSVRAFDIATGRELWEVELDHRLSSGVAANRSVVIVGTADGAVIALEADSGETRWERQVSSEVLATPSLNAELAVVVSIDGLVMAFGTTLGEERWTYRHTVPALTVRGSAGAVIANQRVYSAGDSGHLVALDLADGGLLWERQVAVPSGRSEIERLVDIDAPPAVGQELLWVTSYQGNVTALGEARGRTLWSRPIASGTGIDVAEGQVFLSDDEGVVWALDAQTGASMWKQAKLKYRRLNRPVNLDSWVAVADLEGYVHLLSRFDGRFMARIRVDSAPILAPMRVADNHLLVHSQAGELAVLEFSLKQSQ